MADVNERIEYMGFVVFPQQGKVFNEKGKELGTITKSTGYIEFRRKGNLYKVHRLIYQAVHNVELTQEQQINHINRNRADNRIENLELVTNQQNAQWTTHRTGNFKGVMWSKEKEKWRAELKYNYKNNFLGYFDSEVEAAKAYNDFALYLNETQDCKYLLNTIEGYTATPRNVPEENEQRLREAKSCSEYVGVQYNPTRDIYNAAIKYKKKSYFLGSSKEAIDCAKWYNQQAAFFNENDGCTYTLNNIPGFETVPKDIVAEKAKAQTERKASKYVGVTFSKQNNKWKALLVYNKKQLYIGAFTNEIDAAKAYNAKAIELNNTIKESGSKQTPYRINDIQE